ncbi:PREDICTED: receptor-like protein 12 [Ipomoea nil]|uniref:receptor-like protein 12 n=1 Tax=Ipomoea nil TaxID=35883 RepID=UPI000901CA52|nr:PREDICTED: receptor-like protein 12 [Ipomoea nil]
MGYYLYNHLKILGVIFLCFALHSNVVVSSSSTAQKRCVHSQKLALAQLRDLNPPAPATTPSIECWHNYSMKVMEWNMEEEEDCCSWGGVSCDPATGYVIGLDLSYSMLSGEIFPIFNLHHLQTLNLSCNNFNSTPFPSGFEKLRNLTHLNLSYNGFTGQIPMGISRLTRLVSLDLSWMSAYVELRKPNLESFIMNLNSLEEVYLDGVDLSAQGSNWSQALSSTTFPHLEVLSLSDCSLNGPIHPTFANLKSLSSIHLEYNKLSSEVPTILENFMNLETLNLAGCELYGDFPKNVFRLPKLKVIDISGNKLLRGQFPEFPKHTSLQMISLLLTDFHGELPQSIGNNLQSLKVLDISYCNFWGSIPSSLANLTSIIELDVKENRLTGSLPPFHSTSVPNLSYLDMSSNLLTGEIHSTVFTLPSLAQLRLNDNKFSGEIEAFPNTSSSVLEFLNLDGNQLRGVVPKSIFELPKLFHLSLASNNFNSIVKFGMLGNPKNLEYLDLEMRSCNISKFPEILKGLNALEYLDLSDNKIEGEIPSWIWKNNLEYVNISHNLLSVFDEYYPNASLINMYALYLHGNRIKGSLPSTICNMSSLEILDASDNNLGGLIPECLAKLATLSVFNLKGNRYHQMPSNFTFAHSLRTLNINGNRLKGKLPRSLANCKSLEILDLGNNMISDSFPFWLVKLPSLKVLVLRNNMFYGQVKIHGTKHVLPNLRIVDLSSNNLTGELSRDFFQSLSAMAMTERNKSTKNVIVGEYDWYYRDSVTIVNKGNEMVLVKILTIYVSLDLSNNWFHGNVPEEIGELKSLIVLNLSRNVFDGRIPTSLEELSQLESLDFSQNKFSGMIPPQLTSLTFLEVLNLSYNQLAGRIPLGSQFNTFTNSSYIGNEGLCGIPLSRKCSSENDARGAQEESLESEAMFDWRFAVAGCGFGLVVGLIIGFKFLAEIIIMWLVKQMKKQPRRNKKKI